MLTILQSTLNVSLKAKNAQILLALWELTRAAACTTDSCYHLHHLLVLPPTYLRPGRQGEASLARNDHRENRLQRQSHERVDPKHEAVAVPGDRLGHLETGDHCCSKTRCVEDNALVVGLCKRYLLR